jgi:hypothetical protein
VLRALLVELLPLSDPARAEAPVLAAFLARAVVEPALAGGLADGATALADFVAGHITAAHPAPDLDPQREARTLLALVDGLMLQLLTGQVSGHTALSLIDYHLDRIMVDRSAQPG